MIEIAIWVLLMVGFGYIAVAPERFARRSIESQNRFWGFKFGEKDVRPTTAVGLIVGFAGVGFGLGGLLVAAAGMDADSAGVAAGSLLVGVASVCFAVSLWRLRSLRRERERVASPAGEGDSLKNKESDLKMRALAFGAVVIVGAVMVANGLGLY